MESLELLGDKPAAVFRAGSRVPLTLRRAEILALLDSRAQGWSAEELAALGLDDARADNAMIRLPASVTIADIRDAAGRVAGALPFVPHQMVQGLKFSAALPLDLAIHTLSHRLSNGSAAREAAERRIVSKASKDD